jgi:hypothetical protein
MPEHIASDIIRTIKGEMRVSGGEVDSNVSFIVYALAL